MLQRKALRKRTAKSRAAHASLAWLPHRRATAVKNPTHVGRTGMYSGSIFPSKLHKVLCLSSIGY